MTGFIYAIAAPGSDRVKIGYANDPRRRLRELRCGSSEDLRLLGVTPGSLADKAALHRRFIEWHVCREWFRLAGDVTAFVRELVAPIAPKQRRSAATTGLAAWLDAQGLKDRDFAKKAGLSRSMVTRLRLGRARPSADSALRIIALSNGRLELPDFFPRAAQ